MLIDWRKPFPHIRIRRWSVRFCKLLQCPFWENNNWVCILLYIELIKQFKPCIFLDLTPDQFVDAGTLLSSCKDIESAEIPKGLKEIAEVIYKAGLKDHFNAQSPGDGYKWLKDNCADAEKLLSKFLEKHSHRTLQEVSSVTYTFITHIISTT